MTKIRAVLLLALAASSPAAAGDIGETSSSTVRISVSVAPRYSLDTTQALCLRTNAEVVPASVEGKIVLPCDQNTTAAPTIVEAAAERLLIVRAE